MDTALSESLLTGLIGLALVLSVLLPYLLRFRRKEREARRRFEELGAAGLQAAAAMHPHIDAVRCIGCGSCVAACPEGDVLGLLEGKAVLVHGAKCVGHGLCADACPVGAITMLTAPPGRGADLPVLSDALETSVPNIFIAGELGGIGLIRNAVNQGKAVVDHIARTAGSRGVHGVHDVIIAGAGPAGMAAALSAKAHGLDYLVLEQGDPGGTILQYPRRKIVLTAPVELPLWGALRFTSVSKERMLEEWTDIIAGTGLAIRANEKVLEVRASGGLFVVATSAAEHRGFHVVLALGRRGTPRKLGVPGEGLSKVMYRLLDAESYRDCRVLVVGGGDSAIEAALGLAAQRSTTVTLSYRKGAFSRIRERNMERLREAERRGRIATILSSNVVEILPESVAIGVRDTVTCLPNDYVFVLAGGEMPFEVLRKAGIQFQHQALD
jgi:thioredoxin reductase/NAD-dependent dihydropyrimidine dehydrogenase PreA subunit